MATKSKQVAATRGRSERVREMDWAEAQDSEEPEELDESESAWQRRAQARLKQIYIGKARPEYRRYIQHVEPQCRTKSQPSTPDPYDHVSKRQFDRALGAWRRQLHAFENQGQCESDASTILKGTESKKKDHQGANSGNEGDRIDSDWSLRFVTTAARFQNQHQQNVVPQHQQNLAAMQKLMDLQVAARQSENDRPPSPRVPISLVDTLGAETPPPKPHVQTAESMPSQGKIAYVQGVPVHWMQGLQQWQWVTMETPQKQSTWLIPASRHEAMSIETGMRKFQASSCGPSVGTVIVPEEAPGNAVSPCEDSSPRNISESAPMFETSKFETPRRSRRATRTPSPHKQGADQGNPSAHVGDMSDYDSHFPSLARFSTLSHRPSFGSPSKGSDGNSVTKVVQAEGSDSVTLNSRSTRGDGQGGSARSATNGRPVELHDCAARVPLTMATSQPSVLTSPPDARPPSPPRSEPTSQCCSTARVSAAAFQSDADTPPPEEGWHKYIDSRSKLWYWQECTEEFFFRDSAGESGWEQFQDAHGRHWWWHEPSKRSFFEPLHAS